MTRSPNRSQMLDPPKNFQTWSCQSASFSSWHPVCGGASRVAGADFHKNKWKTITAAAAALVLSVSCCCWSLHRGGERSVAGCAAPVSLLTLSTLTRSSVQSAGLTFRTAQCVWSHSETRWFHSLPPPLKMSGTPCSTGASYLCNWITVTKATNN